MSEYKDMFDNEIQVGDYIVYASLASRSAVMSAGRVLDLTVSKTADWRGKLVPKVKITSWNNYKATGGAYDNRRLSGRQRDVSLSFPDRMIVVPASAISDIVKEDLSNPVGHEYRE